MTKILKKSKNPKKKFLEKGALSVFKYTNYLPPCQKSEKTIEPLLRTMPNRQHRRTDWQTGNGYFIGPFWGEDPKKVLLNI